MTLVHRTALVSAGLALSFVVGCSGGSGTSTPKSVGDGQDNGAGHVSGDTKGGSADASGASFSGAPELAAGDPSRSGASISPGAGGASASAPLPAGTTEPGVVGPVTEPPSTEVGTPEQTPGVLTAGAWDDNRNFDRFMDFRSDEYAAQTPGLLPINESEQKAALADSQEEPGPKQTLDVSFVIDTTGSMGDELSYLQTEFGAISDTIHQRYPNADQRWSLVVYRDTVDDYVVRWFDFRTDPKDFQTHLDAQAANGGGDFPESPERGIAKMDELSWRTDPGTARIAFWVADAPHHADKAPALATALRDAQKLGVHIYPVAASGVDDFTEYTMRSAAQLTGGRYLFLTNDSGVGGDHKEPRIPCYFVTHLNDAMVRMVDIEMTGAYREPEASQILRTGGDPKDGACTLESGATVTIF